VFPLLRPGRHERVRGETWRLAVGPSPALVPERMLHFGGPLSRRAGASRRACGSACAVESGGHIRDGTPEARCSNLLRVC
jgi:hypothetical protein